MSMQEPAEWEFMYWSNEYNVRVHIPTPDRPYQIVTVKHTNEPFYSIVKAAHPYHPWTEAERARVNEVIKPIIAADNKRLLQDALRNVSGLVDNPSHWNRLSPEKNSCSRTLSNSR